MYNVQFGDSFLLQEEPNSDEMLLVDFGSDTPNVLTQVENDIVSCCQGKSLSILLTHFHCDHINGLWKTTLSKNVNIRNVYIPDILTMRKTNAQLDFIQLHVLADIFSSLILSKGPVQITLYSLLKQLVTIHSKVQLLKRNATFTVAHRNYQVLWPCFDMLRIDAKVEKSVISMLKDLSLISEESYALENQSNIEKQEKKIHIQYIDDFIDVLLNTYSLLLDSREDNLISLEAIESTFNELSVSLQAILNRIPDSLLNEIKTRVSSMKKQGNRISIVFHDKPVNGESKILMTGDVYASDLRKIIQNKIGSVRTTVISPSYRVIKAPHHGTDTHFLPIFPPCKKILISNGSPAPCHNNWHKISYQYGAFYSSHKGCDIQCTNPRCELRSISPAIICKNCKCVHASSHTFFDIPL